MQEGGGATDRDTTNKTAPSQLIPAVCLLGFGTLEERLIKLDAVSDV